jgi:DNA-binding transcriptional LysR family regulator
MRRYLCAAPSYLERRGEPRTIHDVGRHELIDMPGADGRARPWAFSKNGETIKLEVRPRILVNEALTIYRLVTNGAGLGILSGYLCAPQISAGRLVRLFPEWKSPAVDVSIVFPSKRALAPAVKAFTDFMKRVSLAGTLWQNDPLE